MKGQIKSARQQATMEYAISQIINSSISNYIVAVYLYGSCARNEEKFSSDVDLLLELRSDFPATPKLRKDIVRLRSDVMTDDIFDPEVDLKVVVGDEWKKNKMPFYKNIRKDGVLLWP